MSFAPRILHTLFITFGLILNALSVGSAWSAPPAKPALSVLTWSDYLSPELVAAFEAKTGYKLNFTYFESDETRDDFLIQGEGRGYDLILSSEYALQRYQHRGWLAPITAREVPNFRYIDPKWMHGAADQPQYGMPYFWGTFGIAYRDDLVVKPITRWMDIFDPPPELQGRIAMFKESRDLIGMALLALGYSMNSTDSQELAKARDLLLKQKPYVKTYSYISLSEDSALLNGSVVATQIFNGDALMLQKFNPHIRFVAPEEGTNLWVDHWTVAAQSINKAAAYAFMDFINEPENAAKNALFVYYASANMGANKILPPSHLQDPIINPSQAILDRSAKYQILPPRVLRKWNEIFAEVVN